MAPRLFTSPSALRPRPPLLHRRANEPRPARPARRTSRRRWRPTTCLQQNLYVASKSLYGGGPSNSCGTYSCLWPFTNAAAGTVYLYGTPKGHGYLSNVAARQTGLGRYADPSEVSPQWAPPSRPPTSPPWHRHSDRAVPPTTTTTRPGGLNLIDAYLLTSNRTDLTLAQNQLNFIISGWDTNASDGCPGGVFWEDVAGSERNTTSNGAGAALALELDRLTGNGSDLTWATSTYQWVVHCLGTASGLYNDHVNPNGSVNTAIRS